MALIKQIETLSEEDKKMLEDQVGTKMTVIAQGTRLTGTIAGQDQLFVLGNIEGDINCEGLVWIAKKGKVDGNVNARKVVIEGEINGDIKWAEHIEVKSDGRLVGNIKAAKIRLAHGCFFDGQATMPKKALNSPILKHESKDQKEKNTGKSD